MENVVVRWLVAIGMDTAKGTGSCDQALHDGSLKAMVAVRHRFLGVQDHVDQLSRFFAQIACSWSPEALGTHAFKMLYSERSPSFMVPCLEAQQCYVETVQKKRKKK